MRIYVAGKWEEKERVREVQEQLCQAGHTITYDWTTATVNSREQAERDVLGVLSAEAFVGVFEKDLRYSGAIAEMGIAIANDVPIHILGNAIDSNIFMNLPNVRRGLEGLL
jgi:hypothetical protein